MENQPPSSSSGLLKLEEQLTCLVCLTHYINPKILPCHHSFCQHCLEGLPLDKKSETYYLTCPTCRHCTELPEEGAGAFPVAFTLINLKEIYNGMKKVAADPQQVTCDKCTTANATGYCKDCSKFLCTECDGVHKKWGATSNHQLTSLDEVTASFSSNPQLLAPAKQEATLTCSVPGHDEPLKYYCDTCDESICRDCTFGTHKDHEYDLVSISYTKHYQELEGSLNPVKGKIEALKKVMSALAEREGEIREKGEGVLEEIHDMVEEMVNVLRQSERKLTEQAKRVTDDKLKVLLGQIKSAEISLSLLEDVEGYVEQNLKTGNPQQVLRSKKKMMNRMSGITAQINVEELHPKEKADFILIKDIKSLHHIGDVISPTLCKAKIGSFEWLPKQENVSFSLSMEAPDSSLLSVPLSSLSCSLVPVGKGDDQPIYARVTTTTGTDPGVYRIQCNLSTHGTHTVKVQVYGVHFANISLIIPFNPYLDNITPVHTITELNQPWGVAVSDDNHVLITDYKGHCITILDREGKKVKSLGGKEGSGDIKFSSPRGIAITPDKFILVSDNHRIQKISMDGYLIASVGEEGGGPLQFKRPAGIAISPITGQIYIVDRYNHRIQVLNPDLTFSHSFGSEGSANGEFKCPNDIAIDNQGLVYVTDFGKHNIQKFSPDGKFISQFATRDDPGQLMKPVCITIDTATTGLVYVSEMGGDRISIFTTDGVFVNFVCYFGRKGKTIDQFSDPYGLVFNKDGFLCICDAKNSRLLVI